MFASDAQTLFDLGLLQAVTRSQEVRTPQDFSQAEDLARRVRDRLQLDTGPIYHPADVCERVGLVTYAAALGKTAQMAGVSRFAMGWRFRSSTEKPNPEDGV